MSSAEREVARQLLASGWSPVKTAHALRRRRTRRARQIGWLYGVAHLMEQS